MSPVLANRLLPSLSNKLKLFLSHSETPCICDFSNPRVAYATKKMELDLDSPLPPHEKFYFFNPSLMFLPFVSCRLNADACNANSCANF